MSLTVYCLFIDGDVCMRERVRLCDSFGFSPARACVFATEMHDWHYKEGRGKGSAATQFKVVPAPQSALKQADLSLTAFEFPSDLLNPHQSLINQYYQE